MRISQAFRAREGGILIFGAAHVDIYGDVAYSPDFNPENAKKILGEISLSIGGTGFNVSLVLANNDLRCTLVYLVNNDYFAKSIIQEELLKHRVEVRPVHADDIRHIFYLAQRVQGSDGIRRTRVAVCNDGLVDHRIKVSDLSKSAKNAKVWLFSLNYRINSHLECLRFAILTGKSIVIAGVGEQVVKYAKEIPNIQRGFNPIDCIVLSVTELYSLVNVDINTVAGFSDRSTSERILSSLYQTIPTKTALVTRASSGFVISTRDGLLNFYQSPLPPGRNVSGLGDAAIAAVLEFLYAGNSINDQPDDLSEIVLRNIDVVSSFDLPNISERLLSQTSHIEARFKAREADRNRIFAIKLAFLTTVIGAVLGAVLGIYLSRVL